MVPWNEIVVVDKVTLQLQDRKKKLQEEDSKTVTCPDHDYDTMKPVVLATWKHGFQGGCPERSSVLAESQTQQFIIILRPEMVSNAIMEEDEFHKTFRGSRRKMKESQDHESGP
ncbi:teneurin-m [Trichonephila clavipes]|nr:teneurin-m [Trichonephila clavipes]